jgi:lipoprotein-anchoring transpeptidase ErfK/SrfK
VPVDPESLVALGDLAARRDTAAPAPEPDLVPGVPPEPAAPRDPLALLRTIDPATRQRVLALGAGSVLAGLVCGLLVPATADAASTSPAHLSLAAASPFHGAAPGAALPATGRATAAAGKVRGNAAVRIAGAGLAPAHAAVLVAADTGLRRTAVRTAATPGAATGWRLTRALPARSGTGRRIVYAERSAHLWIVAADGTVLRDYKVTGRIDRPRPGTYRVWSKSEHTSNPKEKLTFDLMVRFARGYTGAPIGFHTIPRTYSGTPIQSESQLGTAIGRGGCVRQSRVDAAWLYSWVRVGDTVVVLR